VKFCAGCGTQFDEVMNDRPEPEQEIAEEIQEAETLENLDASNSESESLPAEDDVAEEETSEDVEPAPETPRTTGPKGPPPSRITDPHPEDSQEEEEPTNMQFSEDVGTEGDQITTQSEDSFEEFGIFETSSGESGAENESEEIGNKSKRRLLGLVLTPILVIGVAFLIVSSTLIPPGTISLLDENRDSDGDGIKDRWDVCVTGLSVWTSSDLTDYDSDGCSDATEDDDDDGDGVLDNEDNCAKGNVGWISASGSDYDSDGCEDSTEDYDDDNDGTLDAYDDCPVGLSYGTDTDGDGCKNSEDSDDDDDGVLDTYDDCPVGLSYGTDTDGDGCKNSEDSDDDDDGALDWNDVFPLDSSEWEDSDGDGVGNNADPDDDNDGVPDSLDVNDFEDTAILITLDTFRAIEQMDWLDSYAEIYICLYLEGELFACNPDTGYWSMYTGTTYNLGHEFFIDLPEDSRYHTLGLAAWDSDSWDDDLMDINPSSDWNSYVFIYDSVLGTIDSSTTASGEGDGQGWDGALTFSFESVDLTEQRFSTFYWTFESSTYQLELVLDYDTYSYFKNLDHSVDYYDISTYARFSTPDEGYIVDLADELESIAIANGYTSDLEKAEFVHAFVGAIQYEYDIDGMGENEYPKYPIEMLWHGSGDCEDAAALYISIVEAMGFDAMLMTGMVRGSDDEEFGGHAWAIVHVPGHNGYGWTVNSGSKAGMKFYFVETTDWYEDRSWGVGVNPWYEIEDDSTSFYDVE